MRKHKVAWIIGALVSALMVTLFVWQAQFFIAERAKRLGEPVGPTMNSSDSTGSGSQGQVDAVASFTAATLLATNADALIQLSGEAQQAGISPSLVSLLNDLAGRARSAQMIAHGWLTSNPGQEQLLEVPSDLAKVPLFVHPRMITGQSPDAKTAQVVSELKRLLSDQGLISDHYEKMHLDVDVRQAMINLSLVYDNARDNIESL